MTKSASTVIASFDTSKLIRGEKKIKKQIVVIKKRGMALDMLIHQVAMSVALHIEQHGDVTLADHMFDNMPKGSRRLALAEWFSKFGKLDIITATEQKNDPSLKGRTFRLNRSKICKLAEGDAQPWFECKKEADPAVEFDIIGKLSHMLKQATKAKKDGKSIKGEGLMAVIQAAVSKYELESKAAQKAALEQAAEVEAVEPETETVEAVEVAEVAEVAAVEVAEVEAVEAVEVEAVDTLESEIVNNNYEIVSARVLACENDTVVTYAREVCDLYESQLVSQSEALEQLLVIESSVA